MNPAHAAAAPARLRALAEALPALAAAARKREPEALHDLRVHCRRLEVELRLWCRPRVVASARRGVRRLRRAAGPVREQEVLARMLREARAGARAIAPTTRGHWAGELERTVERASARISGPRAVARLVRAVLEPAAGLDAESAASRATRARERLQKWR
ncbi:MAG: CHAD domain-containing protein, partial [Candidatus Eisenbacteria bacterium]